MKPVKIAVILSFPLGLCAQSPVPRQDSKLGAVAEQLETFRGRVNEAFSNGSPEFLTAPLLEDFGEFRKNTPETGEHIEEIADTERLIGRFADFNNSIRTLKEEPAVQANEMEILEKKGKDMAQALGKSPIEGEALVTAYVNQVAPSRKVMSGIQGLAQETRSIIERDPRLHKFMPEVSRLQSLVAMGQWNEAYIQASQIYDRLRPLDRSMKSIGALRAIVERANEEYHPIGNTKLEFLSNIKVMRNDLRKPDKMDNPENFLRYKEDLARGLGATGVAIRFSKEAEQDFKKSIKWTRMGDVVRRIGGLFTTVILPIVSLSLGILGGSGILGGAAIAFSMFLLGNMFTYLGSLFIGAYGRFLRKRARERSFED